MPKCLKFSKNNYNRTNLEKYLALCNVPKGNTFTHTSISQNPRSYYIKPNEVDKFHEYYYDHVFVKKRKAYLTEGIKDLEITPIKIDLDFRAWQKCEDGDVPQRLYKMEDIIKICQLYMKVMEDWLITPDPNERECFIMEKDHPGFDKDNNGNIKVNDVGEKRIKDGVHIMFPNITTKTFLQLEFRKYVFKNCEDILDKYNYDNSYANIFDRCVIDRNNWQMYGSRKNTDSLAYKVTQIIEVYQDTFNKVELSKYSNKELVSLLSVRNSNEIPSSIKTEKEFEMEELEHKQQILKRKGVTNVTNVRVSGGSFLLAGCVLQRLHLSGKRPEMVPNRLRPRSQLQAQRVELGGFKRASRAPFPAPTISTNSRSTALSGRYL